MLTLEYFSSRQDDIQVDIERFVLMRAFFCIPKGISRKIEV